MGPLGRDAVTELHKLFDWSDSAAASKGLLLFIDEADAFLGETSGCRPPSQVRPAPHPPLSTGLPPRTAGSRSRSAMSENQRNALNALLFRTGEASKRFMLVLATNRPGDLDRAVADRVDESMGECRCACIVRRRAHPQRGEPTHPHHAPTHPLVLPFHPPRRRLPSPTVFGLPDAAARRALVALYFHTYIVNAGADARSGLFSLFKRPAAAIHVAPDVTPEYLDALGDRLEGFSGREIAKLFISVQGTIYGRPAIAAGGAASPRLQVTVDDIEAVVAWKLVEHTAKSQFGTAAYDHVSQIDSHGAAHHSSDAGTAAAGTTTATPGTTAASDSSSSSELGVLEGTVLPASAGAPVAAESTGHGAIRASAAEMEAAKEAQLQGAATAPPLK